MCSSAQLVVLGDIAINLNEALHIEELTSGTVRVTYRQDGARNTDLTPRAGAALIAYLRQTGFDVLKWYGDMQPQLAEPGQPAEGQTVRLDHRRLSEGRP